jgi:hypothetical protein
MSMEFMVMPYAVDNAAWLQAAGLPLPDAEGRTPTLAEFTAVIEQLGVLPIHKKAYPQGRWEFAVGVAGSDQFAFALGSEREGSFDFQFLSDHSRAHTMILILQRLAVWCGPQVLMDNMTAVPVIVEAGSDVATLAAAWSARVDESASASWS